MKRKVAYLSGAPRVSTSPDAELTGPRSHILGVISAFEALGWEVKRFIAGDSVPSSWVKSGSEQIIASSRLRALAADLLRLSMSAINSRRAWKALGKEIDWVYERFSVLQALGRPFTKNGKTWILETNGLGFIEARERNTLALTGLARRLELRAYQSCDYLVCPSETLKRMILQEVHLPEEKIIVMPNGIDASLFDPGRHKPIRMFEDFTVGYCGSLAEQQNIDLLLEALSDLCRENMPMHLTLVGAGPMRKSLEAHTAALGLTSRVRFVGQVPQESVPDYIMGFDVGFSGHRSLSAHPIFYSPLKIYEYRAMAVPVVASRHEESERIIEDGQTGFLFEPGNKQQLKQALRQAYERRALLTESCRQRRQKFVDNESWLARVSAVIAFIDSKQLL